MSTAGRFKLLAAAAVVMTLGLAGCGGDSGANSSEGDGSGGGSGGGDGYTGSYGSVTHGGKTYKTVNIGTQTWMAENLNYDIPDDTTDVCYNNDPANCAKYGRLYDWYTAMNRAPSSSANPSGVQGVCPAGWHLPSNNEWDVLVKYAGGLETAGEKLKSTSGWYNNGTNEYGFSALPGGSGDNGHFNHIGNIGSWWSATQYNDFLARHWYVNTEIHRVRADDFYKTGLKSVRCVKN